MTIHVEKVGRDLHITLEGAGDPYVIRPLPGKAGLQITNTYLDFPHKASTEELLAALQIAVDGGVRNPETWKYEPLSEEQQINFNRIGEELSQEEGNDIIMPAFYWQTLLGMSGVKAYVEEGGGLSGTLKASTALSRRLGRLVPPTSPMGSVTG